MSETIEKPEIQISVRALVEFLLRSGDLRSGSGFGARDAMLEGARIHRKIQSKRGADYHAEVPLRYENDTGEILLTVEGRADGLFFVREDGADIPVIEEIKGIYRNPDLLEEPVPVHLAQAKCYAAIYARQNREECMRVRLTYVHMETERERLFEESYSGEELADWFDSLMDSWRVWAELQVGHEKRRNDSMQDLEFPFPYRAGQRDMVVSVYRTILRKKQIFVQAPTGVGKTMSAVFPAVRALGEGQGEKIFYLTAKTIARTVAEEAFAILRKKGLVCKAVTLTAKEKLCPMEEVICDPESCPYARGHYDRVNNALYAMLTEKGEDYGREAILAHCEEHLVCPHEFQLDLTLFADAVIGDYNYVFDPQARLRRFFGETARRGDYLFLIDEAHNLVERGREMFSADLIKEEFLQAKKLAGDREPTLKKAIDRCHRVLLSYKRGAEGSCRERSEIGDLILPLMNLAGRLEDFFSDGMADLPRDRRVDPKEEQERRRDLLAFYFRISAFLAAEDRRDENTLIYTRTDEEGRFVLKLFCVNPASNLQQVISCGRAAVFFSATLLPIRYYQGLLSAEEDDYAIYIPSPFDAKNRRILLCTDVSSRYVRRGEEEYTRMAACIHSAVSARCGNYLVYFPSYQMLDAVADLYEDRFANLDVSIFRQRSSMGEREREEFLRSLCDGEKEDAPWEAGETRAARNRPSGGPASRVGFCVLGGIFAEGIDLVGEKLIGAIVVGTGLPQIGDERELLRAFCDRNGQDGFDIAYRLPGMNKVLQAAGRVIRTQTDRGVILLLDDRFAKSDYRDLFPVEWADRIVCRQGEIGPLLGEFWEESDRARTESVASAP